MNFIESRGNDGKNPQTVSFSQAILSPMSSFGGIYVPEALPSIGIDFLQKYLNSDYKTLTLAILNLFNIDTEQEQIIDAIALYDRFDSKEEPVPVVKVKDGVYVCELYHGPTRAFKDMALQPFGHILSCLAKKQRHEYLILAATSGDTGPAALETFKNKDNIRVVCLYPDGGTSDVQRLQMVTEDAKNLKVIGIKGDFDDAQRALKTLLTSDEFNETLKNKQISLSAANSVNFGRIIFQIIYHIYSYLQLVKQQSITMGGNIYINVPSGNFGNALGGYYALKMGLPIEKIMISSNKNNVLTELINQGKYNIENREVIQTSSPAMDILKSSNIERVLYDLFDADRTKELMQQLDEQHKYQLTNGELEQLQRYFVADYCSDEEGQQYIQETLSSNDYLMDPHTATCFKTLASKARQGIPCVIYSTAEWTKFSSTVLSSITNESTDNFSDEDALKQIATLRGISVPKIIDALFEKEISQSTIIEKEDVVSEILRFLEN